MTDEKEDALSNKRKIKAPILPDEALGDSGLVERNVSEFVKESAEFVEIPQVFVAPGVRAPEEVPFAVRIEGDLMENAGIPADSVVVIDPIAKISDNDRVLVAMRKYRRSFVISIVSNRLTGNFEIRPSGSVLPALEVPREDAETEDFRICGKVVAVLVKSENGYLFL